jgi:hypothetical protein
MPIWAQITTIESWGEIFSNRDLTLVNLFEYRAEIDAGALTLLEVDSSAIYCCMAKNLRYECKQSKQFHSF